MLCMFVLIRIELQTSHMLGKHSSIELHSLFPQALHILKLDPKHLRGWKRGSQVQGQPGLCWENLSQTNNKNRCLGIQVKSPVEELLE